MTSSKPAIIAGLEKSLLTVTPPISYKKWRKIWIFFDTSNNPLIARVYSKSLDINGFYQYLLKSL